MVNRLLSFLLGFLGILLVGPRSLTNAQESLAQQQFEAAKRAFNQQDFFQAERFCSMARQNAPGSAAPWLLAGNCFYLQGQDATALFHYSMALRLDPHAGPLPPFLGHLRQESLAPKPALQLSPLQLADLQKKIGQMIMVSVPGTRLSGQKKAMLNAGWIGGVILFDQNIKSKRQVRRYVRELQRNSPTPLFVAVDQEGGAVRRLREKGGFRRLPSLAALGKTRDPKLAYRFGLLSGRQLRDVGANLNLAPVVDVDRGSADSVISKYKRSLGSDPRIVSSLAVQIVRGMRAQRVIATAKHFPSQTASATNPHEAVAVTDIPLKVLESLDFLPYRTLIQDRLLDAVMLSHVVYQSVDPYYPASLSTEMVQTILRGRLGYQGLVISDDLRMDAVKKRYPLDVSVVRAANAGVDILLVTDNYEKRVLDSLVEGVLSGKVPLARINEAYGRIMAMKRKYGIVASGPNRKVGTVGKVPGTMFQGQKTTLRQSRPQRFPQASVFRANRGFSL